MQFIHTLQGDETYQLSPTLLNKLGNLLNVI